MTHEAQIYELYQDARTIHERTDKIEYFGFVGFFAIWAYLATQGFVQAGFLASAAVAFVVLYRVETLNFYLRQTNDAIRKIEAQDNSAIVPTRSTDEVPKGFRFNRRITWTILIFVSISGFLITHLVGFSHFPVSS